MKKAILILLFVSFVACLCLLPLNTGAASTSTERCKYSDWQRAYYRGDIKISYRRCNYGFMGITHGFKFRNETDTKLRVVWEFTYDSGKKVEGKTDVAAYSEQDSHVSCEDRSGNAYVETCRGGVRVIVTDTYSP